MKIALDLDGTYHANRLLFNEIARRFQDAGHQVGILTSRHHREGTQIEFSPDFVFFLDIGDLDYEHRAMRKADLMQREYIDIIFDDHARYFPTTCVALHIL